MKCYLSSRLTKCRKSPLQSVAQRKRVKRGRSRLLEKLCWYGLLWWCIGIKGWRRSKGDTSVFFLVSRGIRAALGHKKADEVLNPDGAGREGDLTIGKKGFMMFIPPISLYITISLRQKFKIKMWQSRLHSI